MWNFFLSVSFIVSVQVRIFPLNMGDIIIYIAQWWEKYLQKRSLIKHTCSWRDKLIILWTLKRQAKIFLRISLILLLAKKIWKKTVITAVTQNNAFPIINWINVFGEVLHLTIENNCYWIEISCVSSFVFFKYSLKYSNPQFIKGLSGTNWPLN